MKDDIWQGLNERQQKYMEAIYEIDQRQEYYERRRASIDRRTRPADEWRWMEYADTVVGYTPIKQRLAEAGVVDPGTGSTFEALEKRGYILVKYRHIFGGDAIPSLRLTTKGRKLVRQALNLKSQHRKKGELSPRQQVYADKIINAGIASREEVETAFRDKTSESEDRISIWGSTLSGIQRKKQEEYNRTHPDIEHCAVCGKEIEVYYTNFGKSKLPARHTTIRYDVPGYVWGMWSLNAEEEYRRCDYYGCCPEHEEIIKCAKLQVTATLVFDDAEEQRIKSDE